MKTIRILMGLVIFSFSTLCIAQPLNVGLSTPGKAISLDLWFHDKEKSNLGYYIRTFADSDNYYGNTGSICIDGSITNSISDGACNNADGLDHIQRTTFNRAGLMFGPTYWVTSSIQLHAGIVSGFYLSKEAFGENNERFSLEWGLDFGASYKLPVSFDLSILLSHEIEQNQSYLGFWMPVKF